MKTFLKYFLTLLIVLLSQNIMAQDIEDKELTEKIELLEATKERITASEKEALKIEIEQINQRLEDEEISMEEARELKESAAKKRALNIENKIAIVDNKIALLRRNQGEDIGLNDNEDGETFNININGKNIISATKKKEELKFDRRTYVDPVIAIGLNNVIIDGQSLDDSPYKIAGSRFFEFGWAWRTRVFKNSNALRLHYGVSFQFNGLKPKNNQYFVNNDGVAELEEFEFDLSKSKLRMDNLVFPVHFEFGPSKFRETKEKVRYSLRNQFRVGLGGYAGFNIGTRQKLKYRVDGEQVKDKLKRGYNTSGFVYGLSAYAGFDSVQLYVKYDLNPIFKNAAVEQRNISLGLRFDFD